MKTLYLDIFSGISGDMFIGAMLDLGVDFAALEAELAKLGLDEFHAHAARGERCHIAGTKFDVHLEASHEHHHEPTHAGHAHAHSHSPGSGPLHEPALRRSPLRRPSGGEGGSDSPQARSEPGEVEQSTVHSPKAHPALDVGASHEHDHGHDHEHEHAHEQEHEHAHGRDFADIRGLIERSGLSSWVKERAVAIFRRIAEAEGRIHGRPADEVHFHEVGAVDSIVDIVGACVALELLGRPRVLAGPVVEGTGFIHCAHGRFPIPAPATLEILAARGAPITQCEEPHELVTPTGAAILAEFVEHFGPVRSLILRRVGYGLGTRENQTRPNVLRAVLGDGSPSGASLDWETDSVAVLQTNLDDTHPEVLGAFVDKALAAGALDVFYTPVQMKKNRPGVLLSVLCGESEADRFSELILRETTAFGVRRQVMERRKLIRETTTVTTAHGTVSVKVGRLNGLIVQVAPEYESCRAIAEKAGVPLKRIYEDALRAFPSLSPS